MDRPATRFVASAGVQIGYQVFGDGPDLVVIAGGPTHLELRWYNPVFAAFYRELARFCRVIIFDKRGVGISDRTLALSPLEEQEDDVAAVMQAAGSESAFIHGYLDGGVLATLFAVAHPEATRGLIIESCPARVISAPDYPFGFAADEWERLACDVAKWSLDEFLQFVAPQGFTSDVERDEFVRYAGAGAGPAGMAALMRSVAGLDLRGVLGSVGVPTLVLGREDDVLTTVDAVRHLAESIPNATFVELPSGPSWNPLDPVLDEVTYFITGQRRVRDSDRVLATLVFVDVVGSTEQATHLGDVRWRDLLDLHDDAIRERTAQFGGRVVKTTGDGALLMFDGPARAVRACSAIREALTELGIAMRGGVHTGEVELRGDDIAGLAVHVAARVQAAAAPGEIAVTRTVTELVAGSGLVFDDRGIHQLKGVDGEWQLFAARTT